MSERVLNARIQARNDTASAWTAANPILIKGEFGIEDDTRRFKIGDGIRAWNVLPYWGVPVIYENRDPVPGDRTFPIGTLWVSHVPANTPVNRIFILVGGPADVTNIPMGDAIWRRIFTLDEFEALVNPSDVMLQSMYAVNEPGVAVDNALIARQLQTARAFSISGDITAAAINFDGTAPVALSASLADIHLNPLHSLVSVDIDTKGRITAGQTSMSIGALHDLRGADNRILPGLIPEIDLANTSGSLDIIARTTGTLPANRVAQIQIDNGTINQLPVSRIADLLGGDGLILSSLLPPTVTINNMYIVGLESEMLALHLSNQLALGDITVITNDSLPDVPSKSYILINPAASNVITSWKRLSPSGVMSVNGQTGAHITIDTGVMSINGVQPATGANGNVVLTTDNISEGAANLFFTNARADSRADARFTANWGTRSTTDLPEGTNLYFTDARVDARVTSGFNTLWATRTTDHLPEGNTNFYFTQQRVLDMIDIIQDNLTLGDGFSRDMFNTWLGDSPSTMLSDGATILHSTDILILDGGNAAGH